MTQQQKTISSPRLNTILMVEQALQKAEQSIISIAELKRTLPKQINHQVLVVILDYLQHSGKIICSPRGITWIFTPPETLKQLREKTTNWKNLRKN